MRKNVNDLVNIFSKTFSIKEPIIEIGSMQVREEQNDMSNLREYFSDKEYIGCDIRPGKGVDMVENVEKMTFEDSSIGTVLIMDTLEHVQNCHKALDEIHRVLKEGGIVLMSSAMDFKIHDHPYDYWRFTPEAFKLLLSKFKIKIIGFEGNPRKPHTVFAIGIKSHQENAKNEFENFKDKYQKIRNMRKPSRIQKLKKCLKPILKPIKEVNEITWQED